MAYSAANMAQIAYSNVGRLFMYTTTDAVASVDDTDYFLDAYTDKNLRAGDVIITITSTGTTNVFDILGVVAATSATVTTALLA